MAGRYGLEIRAALSGDAAGVAELLGHAGLAVTAEAMAARIDTMRRMPGAVLLAVEWGPPSGIVALDWVQTLQSPRMTARISMLFVAPDARRRGLGRLLVKAASQAARVAGCDAMALPAGGLPAFAEAAGFAVVREGLIRPLRKKGGPDETRFRSSPPVA